MVFLIVLVLFAIYWIEGVPKLVARLKEHNGLDVSRAKLHRCCVDRGEQPPAVPINQDEKSALAILRAISDRTSVSESLQTRNDSASMDVVFSRRMQSIQFLQNLTWKDMGFKTRHAGLKVESSLLNLPLPAKDSKVKAHITASYSSYRANGTSQASYSSDSANGMNPTTSESSERKEQELSCEGTAFIVYTQTSDASDVMQRISVMWTFLRILGQIHRNHLDPPTQRRRLLGGSGPMFDELGLSYDGAISQSGPFWNTDVNAPSYKAAEYRNRLPQWEKKIEARHEAEVEHSAAWNARPWEDDGDDEDGMPFPRWDDQENPSGTSEARAAFWRRKPDTDWQHRLPIDTVVLWNMQELHPLQFKMVSLLLPESRIVTSDQISNQTICWANSFLFTDTTPSGPLWGGAIRMLRSLMMKQNPQMQIVERTEADTQQLLILNSYQHSITNEHSLIKLLKAHKFSVTSYFVNRTSSFNELAEVMADKHVLLGVHSSSMMNMLLMRKGSVIFELFPLITDFMWCKHGRLLVNRRMAMQLGHRYFSWRHRNANNQTSEETHSGAEHKFYSGKHGRLHVKEVQFHVPRTVHLNLGEVGAILPQVQNEQCQSACVYGCLEKPCLAGYQVFEEISVPDECKPKCHFIFLR
jgi:hypothetical protein